jgi:hypothetical protein
VNNHTSETITIQLTKGHVATIDDTDVDLAQFKWYSHSSNGGKRAYAAMGTARYEFSKSKFLHRIVLERIIGRPLNLGEIPDHINGDSLDNRRSNLRLATKAQNNRNAQIPKTNKTGYKGVAFRKERQKWQATINYNNHKIYLGCYDTPQEAYVIYCKAARILHGEFARLEITEDWVMDQLKNDDLEILKAKLTAAEALAETLRGERDALLAVIRKWTYTSMDGFTFVTDDQGEVAATALATSGEGEAGQ